MKCAPYEMVDDFRDLGVFFTPAKCPVCGAFLKWNDMQPECNKCGTELLVIPEKIDGEEMEWGKICPISERKK